jgi:GNAT superfamily N-acetyltransferase
LIEIVDAKIVNRQISSLPSRYNHPNPMLTIRPATAADIPLIQQFIRDLAEYEREPEAAIATQEDLLRDGFGAEPKYRCVIAEWNGEPAGFAFFFYNYSTWQGKPGLYLEDLFVKPVFRGKGIGKSLLLHLAKIAVAENCGRFQWQVLDWNTPAIDFYKSLGAEIMSAWLTMRVEGDNIRKLAELADSAATK